MLSQKLIMHCRIEHMGYVVIEFGLVLWSINYCRLVNAKSFIYIYIRYMISKHILSVSFLNKSEFIFFGGGTQLNGFTYF